WDPHGSVCRRSASRSLRAIPFPAPPGPAPTCAPVVGPRDRCGPRTCPSRGGGRHGWHGPRSPRPHGRSANRVDNHSPQRRQSWAASPLKPWATGRPGPLFLIHRRRSLSLGSFAGGDSCLPSSSFHPLPFAFALPTLSLPPARRRAISTPRRLGKRGSRLPLLLLEGSPFRMAKTNSAIKPKKPAGPHKANVTTVRQAIEAGAGILRLAPTWVPRSFLMPGRRIKLAPQDVYALGAHRGGIDERWFSSTTAAASEGAPPDEGLSYVVLDGKRAFTLKHAVGLEGERLVGKAIWSRYKRWPVYSKFFDNLGPIPHHMHQNNDQAAK